MPNEFIIKNGFRSQGNSEISGSISVLNGATIFNNLTINTSNLPILNLFDSLQSHTWQFRSNGTSLFLRDNDNNRLWIGGVGSGNGGKIGINVINTTAQLTIRGSGATSGTTALLVQNSAGTTTFLTRDDGVSVAYGSQLWVGKSDVGEIAFSNEAATFDKRFSIRFQTSVMFIQGTLGGDKGNISIARDTSQVGFGRGIPVDSAQVQIDSTIRGFLLPRTSATSNITSSVAQGLMTYVTSSATEGLYYYNSGSYQAWTRLLNDSGSQFINGSLGVGTPTPSASLHISGSSGSALFEIDSPAVNNILFVSGSGNVGINTGTPSRALEVFRSGLVDGSINGIRITTSHLSATAQAALEFIHPISGISSRIATDVGSGGLSPSMYFIHNGVNAMKIANTGNVQIGTTTDAGFRLDVNGTARVNGTLVFATDGAGSNGLSFTRNGNNNWTWGTSGIGNVMTIAGNSITLPQVVTTSNGLNVTPGGNQPSLGLGVSVGAYPSANIASFTSGSRTLLRISGSGMQGTGSFSYLGNLNIYQSGSTVLDIQGSQGQLFSVVDALSGSLMSVNDVSGLPILEVFSDDRVVMGTYGAPALIVTGSNTVISGSLRGRVAPLSIVSNTASIDLSSNNFFTITLANGTNTFINPTNINPGQTVNVRVTQGSAGTGTVSFPSFVVQASGSLYTGSAVANAIDIVTMITFDSTTVFMSSVRNMI
jgi:hypothetical protein